MKNSLVLKQFIVKTVKTVRSPFVGFVFVSDQATCRCDVSPRFVASCVSAFINVNSGTRELTLKCKLKCYFKPMNNPLGVSPSKGKQGTTRIRSTVTLSAELQGRTEKVGDDFRW